MDNHGNGVDEIADLYQRVLSYVDAHPMEALLTIIQDQDRRILALERRQTGTDDTAPTTPTDTGTTCESTCEEGAQAARDPKTWVTDFGEWEDTR